MNFSSDERHHDVRGQEGGAEPAPQHGGRDESGHGEAEGDEGGEGAGENQGEKKTTNCHSWLPGRENT